MGYSFLVIDEAGVKYTGPEGGEVETFVKGSKITNVDVEKGNVTLGGLESLEKLGRIKFSEGQSPFAKGKKKDIDLQNKSMPKGANK